MRFVLLRLIRLYQMLVSPALGIACRYEPTCSHYAYEAVERHGAWRGVRLAATRLGRCRPGGGGGYDPVPDTDRAPTRPAVTAADVRNDNANHTHNHAPATDVSPR